MAHEAVPTWSGYNYQGKIAIYHAIKKINEFKQNNYDIEVIKNHKLEIEYFEDFAIIDENDKYISVHQVKAGDSFSSYDEIKKWFDKSINSVVEMNYSNLSGDTKAFIVAQDEDKVYRTKKAEQLKYADTIVICNKNDLEQYKQLIHTKTSRDNNNNQEVINCIEYNTLTRSLTIQPTYTFSNVKGCFKDYLPYDSSITRFLHVSKTHQWTDYIYPYDIISDDGSNGSLKYYCEVNEIDSLIDNQIMIYDSRTSSQIKLIRLKLHELLAQHIADRHKSYRSNPEKCISFSEILSLLDSISIHIDSEDDAYLDLQYKFANCFDEYQRDLCDIGQNINNKLIYLNSVVSNMDKEQIKLFTRLISPNKKVGNNDIQSISEKLVQEDTIKNVYFEIINELQTNTLPLTDQSVVRYSLNSKSYMVSTINENRARAKSVANAIVENYQQDPNIYSLLMNITDIITREINLDNITNESPHIHQYNNDTRERFMKIANIRLIDKDTAKAEINE